MGLLDACKHICCLGQKFVIPGTLHASSLGHKFSISMVNDVRLTFRVFVMRVDIGRGVAATDSAGAGLASHARHF